MSDRGRENNGIANLHTTIRHQLDPSLRNTLQHRWCINKMNIKAEAAWSQFRSQWTPGFEDLLDIGVNDGLYSPSDPLEKYIKFAPAISISADMIFVYTAWYFGGLQYRGYKLRSTNGSRHLILVQDEQTKTKSFLKEYRILSITSQSATGHTTSKLGCFHSFVNITNNNHVSGDLVDYYTGNV
jgi:hypothetical protein